MKKQVIRVSEIVLNIQDNDEKNLTINAKGFINSKESKIVHLVPRKYVKTPKSGIFCFDLIVDSQENFKTKTMYELNFKPFKWNKYPKELKGVKLIGTNNLTINFTKEKILQKPDSSIKTLFSKLNQQIQMPQNADIDFYLFNHAFISE